MKKMESKNEKGRTVPSTWVGGRGSDKRGTSVRVAVKGARSVPQKHQLDKHLSQSNSM